MARAAGPVLLGALVLLDVAAAQEKAHLAGEALVDALRAGGYNLYFRHAATDWATNDHVVGVDDWVSCDPDKMRQLTPAGRDTARRAGEAMRALGIPVGRVLASPYCRTVETARAIGLGPVEATTDIINMRVAEFSGANRSSPRARAGGCRNPPRRAPTRSSWRTAMCSSPPPVSTPERPRQSYLPRMATGGSRCGRAYLPRSGHGSRPNSPGPPPIPND